MARRRYSEPVLTHLAVLAACASGGIAVAALAGLLAITWPDVAAIAIWITGLSMLTAISLSARVRHVIEP
jgi:hypothetical protein